MAPNSEDIAESLLRHLDAPADRKEADFWAWLCVENMIDEGDAREAWAIILRAIQLASTDRELKFLGAGVLESLLYRRGLHVIDAIALEAEREPKVVTALRSAYLADADENVKRRWNLLTS